MSVSLNVYAAECEIFGVRIAGDDFFETSNLSRSPSMRIRSNTIKDCEWCFILFIAVGAQQWKVESSYSKSQCQRRKSKIMT